MVELRCATCGYSAIVGWFWYRQQVEAMERRSPYSHRAYWWAFECCDRWMRLQ